MTILHNCFKKFWHYESEWHKSRFFLFYDSNRWESKKNLKIWLIILLWNHKKHKTGMRPSANVTSRRSNVTNINIHKKCITLHIWLQCDSSVTWQLWSLSLRQFLGRFQCQSEVLTDSTFHSLRKHVKSTFRPII